MSGIIRYISSSLSRRLSFWVVVLVAAIFTAAFALMFSETREVVREEAWNKATKTIESFILNNFHSTASVLTVLMLIFLLLGMVMDTGPAIIILAPVLLPAVQALGGHPVHFGVILVCCLSIGLATPPFGLDLFVAGNLANKQPMAVAKKALPFMIAFVLALLLITYVPFFSTALLSH